MRYLLAVVLLVVAGSVAAACSDGSGTTGGGGAGGGGGTGGACDVATCDPGGDCQVAVCTAAGCGLDAVPDGTKCGVNGDLQCQAGQCQGCASADQCSSGLCAEGICCDKPCDGACLACTLDLTGQPNGVCAPLLDQSSAPECSSEGGCGETPGYCKCADGIKNGDETDIDCGGVCGSVCGNGSTCAKNGDCVSGNCVNGLCCNEPCEGACEACDTAGRLGLCLPLGPGEPDAQCQGTSVCGASGACAKPAGEACAQDSECASNLCKGSPAVCAACLSGADCAGGGACIQGACFAKGNKGAPCLGPEGCASGFCVDGVCCESACEGLCMACHFNLTAVSSGECEPILGQAQGFNGFYDPQDECAPAPGGGAYCSGAAPDADGNSSCGGMP